MPASFLTTMTPAPVPKDEIQPSNLPACVMMGTLASALGQQTMTQHSPHAYEQLLVGWIAGAFSTPVALCEMTHITELCTCRRHDYEQPLARWTTGCMREVKQ